MFLIWSSHKNMHSLKFVDKRRLFKATIKLVDCGTPLYSFKSMILSKEEVTKENTESIHGKE